MDAQLLLLCNIMMQSYASFGDFRPGCMAHLATLAAVQWPENKEKKLWGAPVVGKVTVTQLLSYVTSYFL